MLDSLLQSWQQLSPWPWLMLCLLLLVGEALGASGFLIGMSLAAAITFIATWVVPDLSWQNQLLSFSLLSVIGSLITWRWFRGDKIPDPQPQLNHRSAQLIGRRLVLEQDIDHEGRLQIGDTLWRVKTQGTLKAGTHVQVVDADVLCLVIEAID